MSTMSRKVEFKIGYVFQVDFTGYVRNGGVGMVKNGKGSFEADEELSS
jgi:hypothetical protein